MAVLLFWLLRLALLAFWLIVVGGAARRRISRTYSARGTLDPILTWAMWFLAYSSAAWLAAGGGNIRKYAHERPQAAQFCLDCYMRTLRNCYGGDSVCLWPARGA
jgi:hypothetical protein